MILAQSKPLRLTMMSAFYFTQGIPNGLFLIAVPAWIVANGGTAVQTAQVVSSFMFFWIWKFVTAMVMDRYTFLPMGRRRAWIIGAQAVLTAALLISAIISPMPDDIALLSIIALACGFGASTQDVGIDGLAVDILKENERSIAAGLMYGCGMVGMSAAGFTGGLLMDAYGVSAAFLAGAIVVGAVLTMGIMLKEREGERRLPWSPGNAHPRNIDIKIDAWWPLFRDSVKAIFTPLSIAFVLAFMAIAVPNGIADTYHPILAQQVSDWTLTEYTSTISTFGLAAGIFAMVIGGWIVSKLGEPLALRILLGLLALTCVLFALIPDRWAEDEVLIALFLAFPVLATMATVAALPIAMRLCDPRVAATQYTVYMATGNLGRPIGAAMAAGITTAYAPELLYYAAGGVLLTAMAIATIMRFPLKSVASVEAIEETTAQVEDIPVPDVPATP